MIERTDNPVAPARVASRTDETAESLRRIEASLARMEARIAALECQATAAVGVATDSFDRLAADARARSVDVDARIRVALRLAEKMTDPQVAAAIERLLDLAPQGPALAATAMDTFDGAVARMRASGVDLDARLHLLLGAALGKDGVCSNYRYDLVDATWRFLKDFKGGDAVFTFPSTPVKCAGAPQKIMYLADDHLRRLGVRARSKVTWASASAGIFGVAHYAAPLRKVIERKGIETLYRHDLIAVRPASKEAVFRHIDKGHEVTLKYDLLHVAPPQSAPDFVKKSPLAGAGGWVDVDKYTLQHVRHPDVWSLGDASSLPTSRTGAAIRKQAPVLVENLLARVDGRAPAARYDGYASCPLVTGYGTLILAEFDYDGKPQESFPFDQTIERYSMYAMKAYALPELYWNGMLRGRA
jgi:sulfide:quinone oxidoreductase